MRSPTSIRGGGPLAILGLLLVLALFGGACTGDASFICERRKECVSSGLDVDRCVDEIEDFADDSATAEGRVKDCAKCIEGKTCSEAIGSCGAPCFGVPGWT